MATLLSLFFHQMYNLTLPQFLSLAITILLTIFILNLFTKSSSPNLPPSPPSLPVLGHLHRLGRFPHRSLQLLSSRYGPVMFLRLGSVPTVVLSSASAVEQLVRTQDAAISSRPRSVLVQILTYGANDVVFAPYGEYWRQARRICVLHLLSSKQVQSFRRIREQEVSLMIDKMRASCAGGSTVLNLSYLLVKFSNDVICSVTLGQKKSAEEANYFNTVIAAYGKGLGQTPTGDIVPWLGWLDRLSGIYTRARETSQRLDRFLEGVIEEHAKAKREGEEVEGSDLIDVLLNVRENDKDMGATLSHDNIKAIILVFN